MTIFHFNVKVPSRMNTPHKVPVFILAGGLGTRLSEETHLKPKPMIEIGEIPILVHIMRSYYAYGFDDFVILAGYRSWEIKQYFLNYEFRQNHLMIDHRKSPTAPAVTIGPSLGQEKWRVRVLDTGHLAMTGARMAKAFDEISREDHFDDFAVTYGDGLSDVNMSVQLEFHYSHNRIGTVLGVPPMARFGELNVNTEGKVESFLEKPQSRQGSINGGFFFFKRKFREYLETADECVMERKPLVKLVGEGQLMMFPHLGFWHPMDTLKDKTQLEAMWNEGKAPWFPRAKR